MRRKNNCENVTLGISLKLYRLANAFIASLMLCAGLGLGVATLAVQANSSQIQLENMAQKSLYEAADNLNNIEVKLSKAAVCADLGQLATICSEIWRQADNTATNLAQLPASESVEGLERLVNEVGDYCHFISKKAARRADLEQSEIENIEQMRKNCGDVAQGIEKLLSGLNDGERLNQGWLKRRFGKKRTLKDNLEQMRARSVDYPKQLQDGSFSSPAIDEPYKMLNDFAAVSETEAEAAAQKILCNYKLEFLSKAGGELKTFEFKADKQGCDAYAQITERGARLIMFNCLRELGQPTIDTDTAKQLAQKFAQDAGYGNMQATWLSSFGGEACVCLAYKQGNTLIYSDSIKVKVALDNGEITGFEAASYLKNHSNRKLAEPQISKTTALNSLSKNLKVLDWHNALIDCGGDEVLCYQFHCTRNNDEFFVFIDAATAATVDIQMVVYTPSGAKLK